MTNPSFLSLPIISFCSRSTWSGCVGWGAILMILAFCLANTLKRLLFLTIFGIFLCGWPVESQFRTFGSEIFLKEVGVSNTYFSCISAIVKPSFMSTLIELTFSFWAGGINTAGLFQPVVLFEELRVSLLLHSFLSLCENHQSETVSILVIKTMQSYFAASADFNLVTNSGKLGRSCFSLKEWNCCNILFYLQILKFLSKIEYLFGKSTTCIWIVTIDHNNDDWDFRPRSVNVPSFLPNGRNLLPAFFT